MSSRTRILAISSCIYLFAGLADLSSAESTQGSGAGALPFQERVFLNSDEVSDFRREGRTPAGLSLLLERTAGTAAESVILKVDIPLDADEVQQYGPQGGELYREMSEEATTTFLASISNLRLTESPFDFRAISGLPYVVVRVNSRTLPKILRHESVRFMSTLAYGKPALNQSIGFIGADDAHTLGYSGTSKVVAVIDTGVDSTNAMFSGKVVSEACYSRSDPNESWKSICNAGSWGSTVSGSGGPCQPGTGCSQGHGSHVAGIAVGSSVSPSGTPPSMKGVAYGAGLISIMPFTQWDRSAPFSDYSFAHQDDVLESLMRVYTLRSSYDISAVNLSFLVVDEANNFATTWTASNCDSSWPDIYDAVALLNSAGIEVVAASGNAGQSYPDKIAAPACLSNVTSVASVAKNSDAFQPYANTAPNLDMVAPGGSFNKDSSQSACSYPYIFPDGIWSAYFESSCPDSYLRLSGTSMAAPHVSGSVALLDSRYPDATRSQRVGWMKASGVSLSFDQNGNNCTSGSGCYTKPRLDVDAAMSAPSLPGSLPSNASTNWQCYGFNDVSWTAASSPVTEYEVQGSTSSSFTGAWTYYSGPNTAVGINVQQTTYVRVRACNYVSCGGWVSAGTASYYPYCP